MSYLKKIICALLLLVAFVARAECKEQENINNLPPLNRIQVSQIGDGEIILIVYGTNLPMPEVLPVGGTDDLKIVFKNSFNEIKEKISQSPELPLVSEILFSQEANDAVIFLQTEGALVVKGIRGVPPANRYTITLISAEKERRLTAERTLFEKRLPAAPMVSIFTGNTPVTMELRDVPLADVVRMLGSTVKKNIVIDKSMPNDFVTMSLNGVPLNEAISYLKRMYDIDFAMMGENTIVAGARDSLSKLAGRETTRGFLISYADVTKISDILSGVMELTADEKRKIIPDERLRQIYVTASPERLEEIAVVLQRIDSPGKQIMLHARILEFNKDEEGDVTAMINAIYDNWWFQFAGGIGQIGIIDGIGPKLTFPEPITPINNIINGNTRMIDASLRAFEENRKGKILANPSVITIDGQQAEVNLTTEYPYRVAQQTSGGSQQLYTTETREAGPKLTMTPKVGRDGLVTIELKLEASEFVSFTTDGPVISKRQVNTNVRVRNGEPFVVGGLHREFTSKNIIKFPILGDIPLLGTLFRSTTTTNNNTQVVMLVVPYILDTPDSAVEMVSVPFRR